MKKLVTIACLFGSLVLAGCDLTTGSGPAPQPAVDVSGVIGQAKNYIAQGCSISASTESITAILNAIGVPYVGMAQDVADKFCSAFNKPGAVVRGSHKGPVTGTVVVKGKRVHVTGTRIQK